MYQCQSCRWTGEHPAWFLDQDVCPECSDDVAPICDACFYRSGFEEHLPIPFWFRFTFRLKYLLGYRVKPLR